MTAIVIPRGLIGARWAPCGRELRSGLDCWGVVRALRPDVPDYAASPDDALRLARAVAAGLRDDRWQRLGGPQDGAVVRMASRTRAAHFGVQVRARVIHATREDGVRADPQADLPSLGYTDLSWWDFRP